MGTCARWLSERGRRCRRRDSLNLSLNSTAPARNVWWSVALCNVSTVVFFGVTSNLAVGY